MKKKRNLFVTICMFVSTFTLFAGDNGSVFSIQSQGRITCENGEVISMEPFPLSIKVGEEFPIEISVDPGYEAWTIVSSDPSIASVNPTQGTGNATVTVTGLSSGTCTIIFTLVNSTSERATVYIPVTVTQ